MAQPELDDYEAAMAAAGHILARRPRTEHELRSRLDAAGFDGGAVRRALDRLRELALVDDTSFARRWVEERSRTRGLGAAALVAELEAKGIDRETAEDAVSGPGSDEDARATEVAGRLLRRVAARPLTDQARLLLAMLARRGFSLEAAEAGVRAVLPPEGWD